MSGRAISARLGSLCSRVVLNRQAERASRSPSGPGLSKHRSLFGVRAMSLSSFDAGVSSALVVDALRRDGAAIVRNLASATLVDAVTAELRVKLDDSGTGHQATYPTGFSGRKTLR